MRERPARVPAVAGSAPSARLSDAAVSRPEDDGPPGIAGERPVAREDPGDRGADRRARAEDRDLAADVEAVAGREPLGDEGVRRAERGRRRAADDVEVADAALPRQVDAEDGDRLGRGRPPGTRGQERPPFGRRGGQRDARHGLDRRERPIAEPGLRERARPAGPRARCWRLPGAPTDASRPALTARVATSTATPMAMPNAVSSVRAGRATRWRQAYGTSPRMGGAAAPPTGRAARGAR